MSSPVLMMMPLAALTRREKYWSKRVRKMLMSRKRMPYMASLSSMSRPCWAASTEISGMHRPEA
ncbi:hypothetical protein D3C86_1494670 [compost metagenome]